MKAESFFQHNRTGIILIAIIVLATILRLYHLDFQCMTWDEEFTRNLALTNTSYIINFSFTVDCNPPLYYLMAYWSGLILHTTSPFAMRLPAAIAGILSIPVIFLIGKEFKNDTLGLLMAFFVTVTYSMIFYGQFARAYSLVFLAFAIVTYAFIKIHKNGLDIKYCLIFTAFSAISLWSHFYSIIPMGLLSLILLIKYQQSFLKWIGLIIIWCLPFIFYINVLSGRAGQNFGGKWWQVAYMLPLELFWIASIVLIPLGLYYAVKHFKDELIKILLIVSSVTAISTIIISFIEPVFPRYALLVSPMFLILALTPIAEYIDNQTIIDRKIAVIVLYAFLIAVCSSTPLIAWYYIGNCPYT